MMTSMRIMGTLALLLAAALFHPSEAAAHCDSMDGPVVKAAQAALEAQDVDLVLMWVLPDDEAEVRAAFERTVEARRAGGDAGELVDRWFYETVVRVHRMGEGASYTGLRPAGYEPAPGIVAADRVLESDSVEPLAERLTAAMRGELEKRYHRAQELRTHDPRDVEAGRAYVEAYVDYIHFVESLHALITGHAHGDAAVADPH
jgi:hypothetical protein